MITLFEVKNRLAVIYGMHTSNLSTKDKKSLEREAVKLELCKRYLEFNPTEVFVNSEITRIDRALCILKDGFSDWFIATPEAKHVKNPESKFRKDTGITDMTRQLKMLRFLNNGKVNTEL